MTLSGEAQRRCSAWQGEAWTLWNASYHAADPESYRTLARTLYQQDWHERIAAQFARLDEQNARLDALGSMDVPPAG